MVQETSLDNMAFVSNLPPEQRAKIAWNMDQHNSRPDHDPLVTKKGWAAILSAGAIGLSAWFGLATSERAEPVELVRTIGVECSEEETTIDVPSGGSIWGVADEILGDYPADNMTEEAAIQEVTYKLIDTEFGRPSIDAGQAIVPEVCDVVYVDN